MRRLGTRDPNQNSAARTLRTPQRNGADLACVLRARNHEPRLLRVCCARAGGGRRAGDLHGEHFAALARVADVDELDERGVRGSKLVHEGVDLVQGMIERMVCRICERT